VATDIAARGIDIEDMEFVINYELSNIPETYVHRIGRTGRAGAKGTAISFCDAEEKPYLKDIEKLIGKKVPINDEHPFPLIDHNPVKAPRQERFSSQRQPRKEAVEHSAAKTNQKKWFGKSHYGAR